MSKPAVDLSQKGLVIVDVDMVAKHGLDHVELLVIKLPLRIVIKRSDKWLRRAAKRRDSGKVRK